MELDRPQTPEAHVAAFIAAERARKLDICQSLGGEISPLAISRMDFEAVGESGRQLAADYWVSQDAWPEASMFRWSSEDEIEWSLRRSFRTVLRSDGDAEVHVETSREETVLHHHVFRLVPLGDVWRIAECFELSTDSKDHNDSVPTVALQVTDVHTLPRWQPPGSLPRWVQDRLRPAWRLHALRDDFVTAGDSHLGGPFAGNDRSTWPQCDVHQTPLVGVLQLWKRDVPLVITQRGADLFAGTEFRLRDWEDVFPSGADLLQVYWCPYDHHDQSDVLLRWEFASALLFSRATNPEHRRPRLDDRIPKSCRLFSEYVFDRPSLREAESSDAWSDILTRRDVQDMAEIGVNGDPIPPWALSREQMGQLSDAYCELFGAAPGTKLLGYPDWIQDAEIPVCGCGARMSHLLTITSSIDPTEGPWRIDVTPPGVGFDWDGNLCLGDSGSVYIFACNSCPGKTSIKSVFQCT